MEPEPVLNGDSIAGKHPDARRQTAEVRQPFGLGRLKGWQACGFTLLVTAATLGLRLAFDGPLGVRPTLVMFTIPIMLSAYVGGLRAGLLATVLTYFGSSYYLLPPIHFFAVASSVDRWEQCFVVLAGVFISILNEALHRSRRRADIATHEHQQAEEDRQRFFTLSQDVLCILGFDGYFKDVNPAWEKTLGYTRAALLATPFIEFVHPDDQKATLAEAEKVSGGRSLMAFENRYRCKDGSYRLFQWSVTPVTENRVMYGVARDITERNQAEIATIRLAAIVGSSADAIIGKDLDGIITSWNKGAEKIFGYTADEITGTSIALLIPGDRQEEEKQILEKIRRGESVDLETLRQTKDGRLIDMSITASPITDSTGVVTGVSKVARCITERKRAEEALRESEQRLRFTLESCKIGAWDLDLVDHTAYRSVEHDRIFGYEEMLPQWTLDDFLGHALPEYRAEVEAMVRDATTALRGWTYECPIRRVDGEIRWVWFSGSYRTDHAGHSRVSGIVMDITERKQAEEARRESEARYRTLFENAPDGIVIADREGRYLDANPAICRMLGYSREEMVARSVVDVVILEEISHIAPAFAEVDAGTDHHREWRFRRKDGSVFVAEVIATQVPNGVVMGMVRDITERKRIEARMRRLVDSNVQGVMFWNHKGQILKANDAFLQTVGYTHEDLEAGRIDWTTITPSEYADFDRYALEEIAATGVCTPFEKEFTCKDGSRVPVMIGAAAFEDSPDEGVCFTLDITERRRTEQALRDSEEHFRFLNNLSEATRMLADPARIMAVTARMLGEHLHASRCAYADVEQDGEQFSIRHDYTDGCKSTVGNYQLSLFGTRAVATLHAGQTLIIRNLEAELLAGDGADMFNAIGIKAIITCPLVKDGGLRAMMAVHQTTPRDWEPGEIAIVQDVVERCWATIERRIAEEKVHLLNAGLEQRVTERTAQLEAVNKELDDFAHAASHDLKAPLRVIDNASKWLEEDLEEHLNDDTRRNMALMRGRVRRMDKLLDDMLEYSRIGRTINDSDAETVAGDALMDNILTLLSPSVGFTIKIGTGFTDIQVRRMPLQQILMNLIGNAVKHHDKQIGCIEASVEDNGEFYTFAIKDDGPGIGAQFHEQIFKMFQTLKPRDQVEGSGMGLAMVRKHIEGVGGSLTLESSEGTGSIFRFSWPKHQSVPATAA